MRLEAIQVTRRAGFTVVEMMVAIGVLGVMTYGLLGALEISFSSQRATSQAAHENRVLRSVSSDLTDEFRLTRDDSIQIATLPDGNHEVVFQLPVLIAGEAKWGVPGGYLETPGADDQEDWALRYTVAEVEVDGELQRRLVRQVLNEDRDLEREEVVATDLRDGTAPSPGFNVVQTGDVWNITLSMTGSAGRNVELHVAPRN